MLNYLPYIFCGLLIIGFIYFIFSSQSSQLSQSSSVSSQQSSSITSMTSMTKIEIKNDEKNDAVYEKATKFLNFKITSVEPYADGVQARPNQPIQHVNVNTESLQKQNEEALKRQIENEKRVYSKYTKEQINKILHDIIISPLPLTIGGQEIPTMRIILKEMLNGKDPYICYKTIPQGMDVNKLLELMLIEPLLKALKESKSSYLGIIALFKYKLFSLLLPPDMMTFTYNEKNKTFRIFLQGKPMTLSELTSPSHRELTISVTPEFLPFDPEREKSRLLPQSIQLIKAAREYYNNHPDIAMRLQSYKTNNTLDIPLQAIEDSYILTLSNMYLNNKQLNQFDMKCDLPYDF